MEELHISILYGDETLEAIPSEGFFVCPLCPEGSKSYSDEGYLDHVATTHSKSKLVFEEFTILKCMKVSCANRRRGHYHCPQCATVIFSRGDLVYHVKGHEAKKGKKSKRGRRKGLSSVLQNTNTDVELFNSMTCVVSAQVLSLFPNVKAVNEYFADLSSKYDIKCYIPKENWCIIHGKWKGVQQAKQALEEMAVKAIEKEKARVKAAPYSSRDTTIAEGGAGGDGASAALGGGEGPGASAGADPSAMAVGEEGAGDDAAPGTPDPMNDDLDLDGLARRSSRKRKINQKYSKEFLVAKMMKGEDGSAQPGSGEEGDGEAEQKEDENPIEKLLSTTQQDIKIQFSDDANFNGLSMTVVLSKPELIPDEIGLALEPPPPPEYDMADEYEEELLFKDDTDNDPSVTLNTLQGEESPSTSHWYSRAEEGEEPIMVEELYTCNACQHQMTGREALGAHVSACTNPAELTLVFKCAGCQVTGDEDSIKAHFVDMHFADLNGCVKCKRIFKSASALKTHMFQKGHMSNKYPLMEEPCPVCQKSVKVKNMKQHLKQVHEKVIKTTSIGAGVGAAYTSYGCVCGKSYQQKHTLKMHQDKCPTFLQQQFQDAAAMALSSVPDQQQQQMVAEPQQHSYQCGYCQQNFSDLESTKDHIALHIADVETTATAEPGASAEQATVQQVAVATSVGGQTATLQQAADGTLQPIATGDGTLQQLAAAADGTLQQLAAATGAEGATIQQMIGTDGTIQQVAITSDGNAVAMPAGTLVTGQAQMVTMQQQVVQGVGGDGATVVETLPSGSATSAGGTIMVEGAAGVATVGGAIDQSSLQHLALTAVEQQASLQQQGIPIGEAMQLTSAPAGTGQQETHLINIEQNGEITQIMANLPAGAVASAEAGGEAAVQSVAEAAALLQMPVVSTEGQSEEQPPTTQ